MTSSIINHYYILLPVSFGKNHDKPPMTGNGYTTNQMGIHYCYPSLTIINSYILLQTTNQLWLLLPTSYDQPIYRYTLW